MSFRRLARALCAATVFAAFRLAHADLAPVALPTVQRAFEHGRFAEVLRDAEQALTEAPRAEQPVLHQLAALAAFNLGEHDRSDSHFRAVLRLVPDLALDPYSIPPPATRSSWDASPSPGGLAGTGEGTRPMRTAARGW